MQKPLINIFFPKKNPLPEGHSLLAADVGGTKTDMKLFTMKDGRPEVVEEHRYASNDWKSLSIMVNDFCARGYKPERLSISFAGPIRDGKAFGTNLNWGIDSQVLSEELNGVPVYLINDLEANCYGLAALTEEDLKVIYPGKNHEPGNAAMISPGTGLGEGGLFWDGQAYRPFATEGGHAHFAPRYDIDWRMFKYMESQYGHVSWERVVSGIGICNIYRFLTEQENWGVPDELKNVESPDAAAISMVASKGHKTGQEAMRLFSRYLAEEAANLALKYKATGGLYIGGGIIPKIWDEAHHAIFNKYFFAVGRLFPLVESVPVTLILNQKTAVLGAAYYGAYA